MVVPNSGDHYVRVIADSNTIFFLFNVIFVTYQGEPYHGPYILECLHSPFALPLPQPLLLRWHAQGNCSP